MEGQQSSIYERKNLYSKKNNQKIQKQILQENHKLADIKHFRTTKNA